MCEGNLAVLHVYNGNTIQTLGQAYTCKCSNGCNAMFIVYAHLQPSHVPLSLIIPMAL